MALSDDLDQRGLIQAMTHPEELRPRLDAGDLVAYIGFDPTAPSLHVGHLQQVCMLRRLQDAGHRPIALVGGGTGMIGDPSGRSDERNLLTADQVGGNAAAIGTQLRRFLDFDGPGGAVFVDNLEWLGGVGLIDFLREVGKRFSVNEMVRKDSVRPRLEGAEQTPSFTEFSYMLLMAWDFVQLHDRFGCQLQLGGSDQWGNITEGIDLVRRMRNATAYGLTSPLLLKADGTKFGKTADGAVWLDPTRTSPYAFFQFWLRTGDAEVGEALRRFTFLPADDLAALDRELAEHPERREAQRVLARQVTTLVHGAGEADRAERAAAVLFTEDIAALDEPTLSSALADAPHTTVEAARLEGMDLVEALQLAGLSSSGRDARQHLANGAVYVNNRRRPAEDPLGAADALHGRFVVLRRGKRAVHVLDVG